MIRVLIDIKHQFHSLAFLNMFLLPPWNLGKQQCFAESAKSLRENPENFLDMVFTSIRQAKHCNNLATRVIPFFIASKSSVGKTILKTVLPHFPKDPVA